MSEATDVSRALLSVSNKDGIVEFAKVLVSRGWELLSTGGTAALLRENNIPIVEVSEHTGFPEIMGGRVKTLHPKIHGGILGRRGVDDEVMLSQGIDAIDLVVVNLYPFEATISKPDCTTDMAIENIDIGGPAMLRAAAKNHASVTVLTSPLDYARVVSALDSEKGIPDSLKFDLAIKAFEHTAAYDGTIANHFGTQFRSGDATDSRYPRTLNLQFSKVEDLRYGENPHQDAAFYKESWSVDDTLDGSVSGASQLQGKSLSYNNIADTDTALECVKQFDKPACVIVKHANPCGVAETDLSDTEVARSGAGSKGLLEAYNLAYETDPTSAFGGIIAFNRSVDAETAQTIIERQFVEVIIAPGFSDSALESLSSKTNVRVLDCGRLSGSGDGMHYTRVVGGLLVQQRDESLFLNDDLKVVSSRKPSDADLIDLVFAWKVAKYVKSNAIVFARNCQTIGVGAGQMSRVYSSKIAAIKAADEELQVSGAVMASDAFFPFRDGIDSAAESGIKAVIQPGGSKNDQEVIDAANEHGMSMVFTGMRHFRH